MKTTSPQPSQRRRRLPPLVLVAFLAPVVLGGYYGVQWWRGLAAAAEQRAKVLTEVDVELAKETPDENALSRLMAALDKLPDAGVAADLRAANARVELARGRPERADAVFGAVAGSPTASPAEQRLGAEILLRRAEAESPEVAVRAGWLRQAAAMAQRGYDDGHGAGDLFMVWLARLRLGERAPGKEVGAALQSAHGDSREAKFVQLVNTFQPSVGLGPIEDVAERFPRPPAELDAMRVMVALEQRDLRGAIDLAEKLLARAPGVFAVRQAAATVFHALVLSSPAGDAARTGYVARRDAQLDWLSAQAPDDEPLRKAWSEWRKVT